MASSSTRVQVFVVQASFNDVDTETQAVFDTLDAATTFMLTFVDMQPDVRFDRVTIYRDEDLPGGRSVEARTAPDGHGVSTEAILASYGVSGNPAEGAISGMKASVKAAVSDDDLLQDMVADSDEERRFLAMHVDILRMAGIDRVKQRGSVVWRLYKALPLVVKFLLVSIWLFFILILIPPGLYMLKNVFGSPVAMAKLLLLLLFVLLIMGLQILIGV